MRRRRVLSAKVARCGDNLKAFIIFSGARARENSNTSFQLKLLLMQNDSLNHDSNYKFGHAG